MATRLAELSCLVQPDRLEQLLHDELEAGERVAEVETVQAVEPLRGEVGTMDENRLVVGVDQEGEGHAVGDVPCSVRAQPPAALAGRGDLDGDERRLAERPAGATAGIARDALPWTDGNVGHVGSAAKRRP
jgi:hypothetical protein